LDLVSPDLNANKNGIHLRAVISRAEADVERRILELPFSA